MNSLHGLVTNLRKEEQTMSNSHVNHHFAVALAAFAPPQSFCVSVRHDKGERGFRIDAPDALTATKEGVQRLNIRDEEIMPEGLDIRVEPTK